MTITILEFADLDQHGGGNVVYPPIQRRTALAAGAFHEIGIVSGSTDPLSPAPIAFLVYTTAAVHLRLTTTNAAGNEATQDDPYLAADGSAIFVIPRKSRGVKAGNPPDVGTDRLWIYALTDT